MVEHQKHVVPSPSPAGDTPATPRPFEAPRIEELGELQVLTLETVGGGI
jgi:hypothetical protein